ncbi:hypothetical protein Q669_27860 [Labrenzia sp. C1B10]|nr:MULTISPECIES: hypothetical protein [unclassified Labrenzia]ERP96676.1 hypothetical protein Q669_27860 [Labrenzia sp. C1B10]ERS03533.1 hypothetical protein Q675_31165 [Labrenzia sp. C1B70]
MDVDKYVPGNEIELEMHSHPPEQFANVLPGKVDFKIDSVPIFN